MHIHAKKSLGQNFLKSQGAVREIIAAARLTQEDTVLEIGPGKGVLTAKILESGSRLIAVEKDDRLIEGLKEQFASFTEKGQFSLTHGDILETSIETLGLSHHSFKLIANIPYYITGEIIRQFLTSRAQPSLMVLMVQKEVAMRITTRDNKESLLSLSVKAYGTPRYISTVKAKYFSPAPKVDSAILLIDAISKDFFTTISEEAFFSVIRAGFAHKRKFVVSNLEVVAPKERVITVFTSLSLPLDSRAESLSLSQWKNVAEALTAPGLSTQNPQHSLV